MGIIKYAINRLKNFDKERFNKHIDIISKNTGKSKLAIKLDWNLNVIKYGVSYTDYFRGDYINLTKEEKKTYVTSRNFYKILQKLNDKEESIIVSDKSKFNEKFKEYLKREYIDIRKVGEEGLKNFLNGKTEVVAKGINGHGGNAVSIIKMNEYLDINKIYNRLMNEGKYVVEEFIKQCDELNAYNPNSVSSFRIVTLYNDGKVYVLGNALRMNQGKEQVVGCTKDIYFNLNEDGTINGNVVDDYGTIYTEHPLTKKSFSDFKLPRVKEAMEMCKEAAMLIPKVRYIGWDVAFTQNGPCIVEGNEYPGYGIIQFYKLNGSKTGHKKQIEDIIGKI